MDIFSHISQFPDSDSMYARLMIFILANSLINRKPTLNSKEL